MLGSGATMARSLTPSNSTAYRGASVLTGAPPPILP